MCVICHVLLFFILECFNFVKKYNFDILENAGERPDGVPLVTVCNHTSCLDDPCLWGKNAFSICGQLLSFIPCYEKYSQSECRKAVFYLSVFYLTSVSNVYHIYCVGCIYYDTWYEWLIATLSCDIL